MHKRQKNPPKNDVFQKGVDGQKWKKKYGILKGKTKRKTRKKHNRKKRRIWKTDLVGNEREKKQLQNCRNLTFLGTSTKRRKTKRNKRKSTKRQIKQKTPLCMLANNPQFLVNFCFFQLTLFYFCKAVFCQKHYKNCVFSRTHSFCVSQIVKTPFERLPKMALLKPLVPFWVFPCACWNPSSYSVWWFCMVTKTVTFPKTDSVDENACFCLTFRTQIVLAYFSKQRLFSKKPVCSQQRKEHNSLGVFEVILFHFCSSFSLSSPT